MTHNCGKEQGSPGIVWVEEDVDSMKEGSEGFPKDPAKRAILHMASKKDPAGSTFRLWCGGKT